MPGTIFTIIGLWWSLITAIRFILSKQQSEYKKSYLNGYKTSISMPCIFLPKSIYRKMPVESVLKLLVGLSNLLISEFDLIGFEKSEKEIN